MAMTVYPVQKYLLEAPRYLVSRNMYEAAKKNLQIIAQWNKRPKFIYRLEGEMADKSQEARAEKAEVHPNLADDDYIQPEQSKNYTYLDLFRLTSLRKITIVVILMWIFRYVTYFG